MSPSRQLLMLLSSLSLILSQEPPKLRNVCNVHEDTCTVEPIDPNDESLGQKLLRKQTEVYGLTKLSYSEESAAQSIKVYNPNDAIYDYYWYDPSRQKGICSQTPTL